jgi:alpha-glucosidase
MPWNAEPSGGFTSGEPWLPLGSDLGALNVVAQEGDPSSMLSLYRALLRLRRAEPALSVGSYAPVAATGCVLAYERRYKGRRLLVALNMSGETVDLPTEAATILLSTMLAGTCEATSGRLLLRPHEGCIGAL